MSLPAGIAPRRIAGDCATGGTLRYRGTLGTGIFRVLGLSVAQTGLSEREAREAGYDVALCRDTKPDKPEYLSGKEMTIEAVADRATGRLLGAQIVGPWLARDLIAAFLTAEFETSDPDFVRRVEKLARLEEAN